ncbi:MAG: hypothetical protein K5891_08465 [Lachnospiraceae bacterium]|nr:hypothetical protein [Lachnospiraceae bacterium]
MELATFGYLLFLAVSLFLYFCLPARFQWIVILADNLIFYCLNAEPVTLLYLGGSVLTVYFATLFFQKSTNPSRKKIVLLLALLLCAGLLFVLKYSNLFINTVRYFTGETTSLQPVSWLLPLAISFYSLTLISYLLDCYWGIAAFQSNPLKLFAFISFFPLMVSGPIQRYAKVGEEFFREHSFDYARVTEGMKRIAWGMVKKLAVSNRLSPLVSSIWNDPGSYHGLMIWAGILLYLLQLYTDFSGCMDIALGTAQCFGLALEENFEAPFLSKTTQEFWQRWHITLGKWLRDYIMNPILKSAGMQKLMTRCVGRFGKKKGKKIPLLLSMLVLWLCMGLWHGDSWKYILGEGFWFWLVIALGQIFGPAFQKWKTALHIKDNLAFRAFQVVRTNLIFAFGMIFFKAASLPDAFSRIGAMFRLTGNAAVSPAVKAWTDQMGISGLAVFFPALLLLVIADVLIYRKQNPFEVLKKLHPVLRWCLYAILIYFIMSSYVIEGEGFAYARF